MRLAIVPVAGTRRGLLPRVFTLTFLRGAGYWLWVEVVTHSVERTSITNNL